MYKFLVDIVSFEFTTVFEYMDGSIQLINGEKVHLDSLRSDRVLMLSYLPTRSTVSNWNRTILRHISAYMPLAEMVDNVPLQPLLVA